MIFFFRVNISGKFFFLYDDKGTCQKLLSGFFAEGGGATPIPQSFFGHNDFLLRGLRVTPQSAKGKATKNS